MSMSKMSFYLDKDFLEQHPAVSQGQLLLGVALARGLLLGGCRRWWRRWWLQGGDHWGLGHVRQVEEQVEAFNQSGGHRHGRHAVHRFLGRHGVGGQHHDSTDHCNIYSLHILN